MVLSSIRQGLQVVDQNDRIVGLPFTSEEVLMTSPWWFSIFTSGI